MGAAMIPCPECGKKHRAAGWEEAVSKCKAGREKREAREARKQAEIDRRFAVRDAVPVRSFIRDGMLAGRSWEGANSILAGLKKDYPPPWGGLVVGRAWTLWDVLEIDSHELVPSWNMPLGQIVELRFEKFVLGDFVSAQPPLDAVRAMSSHRVVMLDDPETPADDGEQVVVGGIIRTTTRKTTKRGDPYSRFRLDAGDAGVDVVAFPPMYDRVKELIAVDRIVMVVGRVDRTFTFQIRASDILRPESVKAAA
jgi:hypothetical protein